MSGVIPEQYADLLASTALAHIATLGPDGSPQNSPVWFDWDGTHLRFTQVTRFQQKIRNLQREPRVAVSIVDPANPYRYLEVRGSVERIEANPDGTLIDSLAMKYLGQEQYSWGKPDDEYVVVVIRPDHSTFMG
jgi:PPOX class probable F420-dependent enzyme